MGLGRDYLNDYAYEIHNGGKLPYQYESKTETNNNMNKTIAEVKLMGDPWETNTGNTLYTFGIKYEGGGKAVANSNSDEPWWGTPGTVVTEVKKGSTTKSGCPKVKFDRPEEEDASIQTGHMATSSAPKGGGSLVGIKCGASMNRAVEVLTARGDDVDHEDYPANLLKAAHIIYKVAEQFEQEISNPPAEKKAAPTNPEDEDF